MSARNASAPRDEAVKVIVRCRPFLQRQVAVALPPPVASLVYQVRDDEVQAVFIENDQVVLRDPDDEDDPAKFNFDTAFAMGVTQAEVSGPAAGVRIQWWVDRCMSNLPPLWWMQCLTATTALCLHVPTPSLGRSSCHLIGGRC